MVSKLIAQTTYEKGMTKALTLWKQQKTTEATALFERITNAEKTKWLPPYYVATIEILGSFGLKDETLLNVKLNKAEKFLNIAKKISPNNPEIIINEALLNTAYISFDGQKYGMTLSIKNTELYQKAINIAPKNPRVILGKARWEIGMAQYLGQPTEPYYKDIKKALELFKKEKLPPFYPNYGQKTAMKLLYKK